MVDTCQGMKREGEGTCVQCGWERMCDGGCVVAPTKYPFFPS